MAHLAHCLCSDPSPQVDEVLDKCLQDPTLKSSYKGLANRRYFIFIFQDAAPDSPATSRSLREMNGGYGDTTERNGSPYLSVWFDKKLFPGVNQA